MYNVSGMWLLSVQLLKAPVCIGYVVAFGPVVEGPGMDWVCGCFRSSC